MSMRDYRLCIPCLATLLVESRSTRECFRCGASLRLLGELLVCNGCGLLVPRRERI